MGWLDRKRLMRPTIRGLLFRTFRILFILTVISGGFRVVLSALEGYEALQGDPSPTPAPAPASASR